MTRIDFLGLNAEGCRERLAVFCGVVVHSMRGLLRVEELLNALPRMTPFARRAKTARGTLADCPEKKNTRSWGEWGETYVLGYLLSL